MLDWTWKGFDVVGTLRFIDGFHEQDANLNDHYVEHRWLFDIQAYLRFQRPCFHRPPRAAGYSKDDKDKGGPPPAASSEMSIWDHLSERHYIHRRLQQPLRPRPALLLRPGWKCDRLSGIHLRRDGPLCLRAPNETILSAAHKTQSFQYLAKRSRGYSRRS